MYGKERSGAVSKSRNRLFAPEGLRILAGGASHRERRCKSYIAPAGAIDLFTNVYCRIRRPAPFQGSGIWLPQPRWLAPPANIPSASGAKNADFAIYRLYRAATRAIKQCMLDATAGNSEPIQSLTE